METEPWPELYSHNLTDEDVSVIRDILHASSPGDDEWVRLRQGGHLDDWRAGRLTRELLIYVLAVSEAIVAEHGHTMPWRARLQRRGFVKRMRREIFLVERDGEARPE